MCLSYLPARRDFGKGSSQFNAKALLNVPLSFPPGLILSHLLHYLCVFAPALEAGAGRKLG